MLLLFRRFLVILVILFPRIVTIVSGQEQYKQIFSSDYIAAQDFISANKWLADSLKSFGIDPCQAVPVIFPELIRYSSIRDKIETWSLENLYVRYGRKYSDFSIGSFQMKPSFAEDLEKFCLEKKIYIKGINSALFDTSECESARRIRVERLCSVQGQVIYLSLFIRSMGILIPEIDKMTLEEKVSYLSVAYNSGFRRSKAELDGMMEQSNFYTGIIPGEKKFSYSDISVKFCCEYCENTVP